MNKNLKAFFIVCLFFGLFTLTGCPVAGIPYRVAYEYDSYVELTSSLSNPKPYEELPNIQTNNQVYLLYSSNEIYQYHYYLESDFRTHSEPFNIPESEKENPFVVNPSIYLRINYEDIEVHVSFNNISDYYEGEEQEINKEEIEVTSEIENEYFVSTFKINDLTILTISFINSYSNEPSQEIDENTKNEIISEILDNIQKVEISIQYF